MKSLHDALKVPVIAKVPGTAGFVRVVLRGVGVVVLRAVAAALGGAIVLVLCTVAWALTPPWLMAV